MCVCVCVRACVLACLRVCVLDLCFCNLLSQIKKFVSLLPERALNCFVRGLWASDNTGNGQLAEILSGSIQAELRYTDVDSDKKLQHPNDSTMPIHRPIFQCAP